MGREPELRAVADAIVARGRTGVVITGEAGVGKTRLARAAVTAAGERGAEVVWIRATAAAATIPLAAVVGLLPPADATTDPLRLYQVVADRLLARAGGRRLIIGVDDAPLLDPASAALLLHLAGQGAFVVAVLRTGQLAPDAVTALWKDVDALRLELGPLSREDTGALLEALLGGPAEGAAHHWAQTTSAGNPLYLRELVARAVRSGALESERGLWRLRRHAPPGEALIELVSRRLNGFGSTARQELTLIDLGQPLPVAIADDLADPTVIDALLAEGLIAMEDSTDEPTLRLTHPLYGEVARHGLARSEVDALRVRLAGAIQEDGLGPGGALRVATLLRDAREPVGPDLLLAASDEAYRAREPSLAAELAALAEREGGGVEASLAQGRALATLGRYHEAEAALARIEGAVSRQDVGAYLFARLNTLVWGLGRFDDAGRLVERAAGWWRDQAWDRQVTGFRLLTWSAGGRVRDAAAMADRYAAGERDPGDEALLASSGVIAWLHSGRTATALAFTAHALPPPPDDERLGDRELAGLISWSLTRIQAGREWDEAGRRIERIAVAAVDRGDRTTAGPALGLLGNLALAEGRPRTAIARLQEASAYLEHHDPRRLLVVVSGQLTIAHSLVGDAAAARASHAEVRDAVADRETRWHEQMILTRADAWLRAVEGAPSAGADLLMVTAATLEELPVFRTHVLADALSMTAPPTAVARAMEALLIACDAPIAHAVARLARAMAERDPDGLLDAASALESIGSLLNAAEAAEHASAVLARLGRAAPARRAAAVAARLVERCEGASTPLLRAARSTAVPLTRREREIAELAAAGQSNRQIADRLVVSVRTVESHLYHAMSKVGAADRAQLADLLRADPP